MLQTAKLYLFMIVLGKRALKAAGVALVVGAGAVAAASIVLGAVGFTSSGKNTLFGNLIFFTSSLM